MGILLFGLLLIAAAFIGVAIQKRDMVVNSWTPGDRAWFLCFVAGVGVAWVGVVFVLVDYFSR